MEKSGGANVAIQRNLIDQIQFVGKTNYVLYINISCEIWIINLTDSMTCAFT